MDHEQELAAAFNEVIVKLTEENDKVNEPPNLQFSSPAMLKNLCVLITAQATT